MYKIFADNTLIYDSTIEDYKIGKGSITLEINKSGSFTFSVYSDHFFYDNFVKLKTVITVYKSGRIVFRGRILNTVTDYWGNKNITCEGELGFLQDSIIRPFSFTGSPDELFKQFIEEHNSQVDEFKQFNIGSVTVVDDNDYINRSGTNYDTTLNTLNGATVDSALGGYIYITHGDDGTDPTPTIHYLANFTTVSTQTIEFGSNLKDYTKTVKSEDIATAIIPLGTTTGSNNQRLTIADVNDGVDYIYSEAGVELYGWIFKTVVWDDVTLANNLKKKAESYLANAINQNIMIELNAIDLHLLDRSIESFRVCDYIHVFSKPHNFDEVLLCNKQTMDLLKPENDTVVLGYSTTSFTGATSEIVASVSTLGNQVSSIKQDAIEIRSEVKDEVEKLESSISQVAGSITLTVTSNKAGTSSYFELKSNETVLSSGTISFDGLVTFDGLANGTTVIDGGCIQTGEILADLIKTGILQSNDGETFKLDLEDGSLSLRGSGRFQNVSGDTYITVEGDELVFYSLSSDNKTYIDAIHMGFIRGTNPSGDTKVDYPYMLMGSAGGTSVGLIKKFWNGFWVGNSVPKDASGNFEGMTGASGIFINTLTNETYVVEGTTMSPIYTGAAIARFK